MRMSSAAKIGGALRFKQILSCHSVYYFLLTFVLLSPNISAFESSIDQDQSADQIHTVFYTDNNAIEIRGIVLLN